MLSSAKNQSYSLDCTSIVSVSNNFLRHFSIYIIKSQCILTTVDLGVKSFTEGDILTSIDGYSTDLNFESDHWVSAFENYRQYIL